MQNLSVIRFDDPTAFLEATKQYDDGFMNYGVGSLCDFLKRSKPEDHSSINLLGVYLRDHLLYVSFTICRLHLQCD